MHIEGIELEDMGQQTQLGLCIFFYFVGMSKDAFFLCILTGF